MRRPWALLGVALAGCFALADSVGPAPLFGEWVDGGVPVGGELDGSFTDGGDLGEPDEAPKDGGKPEVGDAGRDAGSGHGAESIVPPVVLVGYGLTEWWRTIDPAVLAQGLAANGLNFTEIEYVGNGPGNGTWNNIDRAKTKAFVAAMREHGIWTMINIVNWNGADQRARSDDEFQAELDFIIDEIGPDHVLLQALSEWDLALGGKAQRWADKVATQWPGAKSWNLGSRPSSGPADHLLDWHSCAVGDLPPHNLAPTETFIVNTDCHTTINDLDSDRDLIAGYVEEVLRSGSSFHYYEAVGDPPNAIQMDVIQKIAQGKANAGL